MLDPRVQTKVGPIPDPFRSQVQKNDPHPDPFTYRGLNNDPNLGFNGLEIGESETHLHPYAGFLSHAEMEILWEWNPLIAQLHP